MKIRQFAWFAMALFLAAGAGQAYAVSANCFSWTNTVGLSGVIPNPATPDVNLNDPWGLAFFPGAPFRMADRGTGLSSSYDGSPTPALDSSPITIPIGPNHSISPGPTGLVANLTSSFIVPTTSSPAAFIFSTQDGAIAAWNSSLADPSTARVVVNGSSTAVYYGLAIGNTTSGQFLYAPNFNSGKIDVFDSNFNSVVPSGSFTDPKLPTTYAPFNIVNIRGNLFVTYALFDATHNIFLPGKNSGYVNVFDTNGNFIKRFASKTKLNAPWGVAEAPLNFGSFGGDILIGNYGDGTISARDPIKGSSKGQLIDAATKKTMVIAGIWGLAFGGAAASDPATLYFTARLSETMVFGGFGPITAQSSAQCAAGGMPY